ncbi:MAG: DUF1569 domain-containing protein [Bacteroidia bacterium]|nr:DUF1569 domain-containing protein [Bacteroidia bacterium]
MNFIHPKTDYIRITEKFTSDATPLWGIMTPQHMLEHLLFVLKAGTGKIPVSVVTPEEKIPRTKAFLMSEHPMPRDFKAPYIPKDSLFPLEFPDFETAKAKLAEEIDFFYEYYENNPEAVFPHPVFGYCNKAEWDMMQRKHFTHHFTQFGIL